jgi:5-methylcytosine-specific restriction endonuclease McrA
MPRCPTCGDELPTERGVKMHHAQVHNESISGVESVCDNCGKTYHVPPSRSNETRFCSMECLYDGDTHESSVPSKKCRYCGSQFQSYEDVFCSRDCYGEWLSENNIGSEHPNWKGGSEKYRGEKWDSVRSEVLERDSHSCTECGLGQEEHIKKYGQELHVHHKTPFREFDSVEKANRMGNLETLCSSCHKKKEKL